LAKGVVFVVDNSLKRAKTRGKSAVQAQKEREQAADREALEADLAGAKTDGASHRIVQCNYSQPINELITAYVETKQCYVSVLNLQESL
jgi:hypothetical protein